MLRKWLQGQGVPAPEAVPPSGPGEHTGSCISRPDMRTLLKPFDVRRLEATLRAMDPGQLATVAACSSVFWVCGHAVDNPEEVAMYALEAKERRYAALITVLHRRGHIRTSVKLMIHSRPVQLSSVLFCQCTRKQYLLRASRKVIGLRPCRLQSHCQALTLNMLESLSKSVRVARHALPPLHPRSPCPRSARRRGPRPPAHTSSRPAAGATSDVARMRRQQTHAPLADGSRMCPGMPDIPHSMRSTPDGEPGCSGAAIPPLNPNGVDFKEWHGALNTAYAVMKGMIGSLPSADVHATHSSVLLLSFEASKMAAQLRRAVSDLHTLQV